MLIPADSLPHTRPPLAAPSSSRLSSRPSHVGVRWGVGGHRMIDFRGVKHTGPGPAAGPPPLPPPLLPRGECGAPAPPLLNLDEENADWGREKTKRNETVHRIRSCSVFYRKRVGNEGEEGCWDGKQGEVVTTETYCSCCTCPEVTKPKHSLNLPPLSTPQNK